MFINLYSPSTKTIFSVTTVLSKFIKFNELNASDWITNWNYEIFVHSPIFYIVWYIRNTFFILWRNSYFITDKNFSCTIIVLIMRHYLIFEAAFNFLKLEKKNFLTQWCVIIAQLCPSLIVVSWGSSDFPALKHQTSSNRIMLGTVNMLLIA